MPEGWSEFFVATAGAAAALAGLIIVAMSVNIQTILTLPGMTSRAAATVGTLVLCVVATLAGLIPGQAVELLGAEIGLATLGTLVLTGVAARRVLAHPGPGGRGAAVLKTLFAVLQVFPFAVGSILLISGTGAGLGWIAAGVLLVFIGSVTNAWVLLVEILR
ncbi:hypothetical protein JL107_10045 [Nakamurella flavida]|uniref:Modulator of FtsH protease n=1 Tax=Nakamurella flavida TaxID=363630 RepID=A0A938YLL0_9ACTN|nr:hypothetical protein [Nakamurella flavida]MBM9476786.1 hypothetical protein [Nakamurella flavida]MDP9778776.1 modulator of FtsH protease [Nakamurella flavida]